MLVASLLQNGRNNHSDGLSCCCWVAKDVFVSKEICGKKNMARLSIILFSLMLFMVAAMAAMTAPAPALMRLRGEGGDKAAKPAADEKHEKKAGTT